MEDMDYTQYVWNESKSREKLVKKMIKAYNKNKSKIKGKPEQPKPTQSELRKRKLADLNSNLNFLVNKVLMILIKNAPLPHAGSKKTELLLSLV